MGINEFHFIQQNTVQHWNKYAQNCAQSLHTSSTLSVVLETGKLGALNQLQREYGYL